MSARIERHTRECAVQRSLDSSVRRAVLISVVMLIASGICFRSLRASAQNESRGGKLPKGVLAKLPMNIGAWDGQEIPLEAEVIRISGQDDFLTRAFQNRDTNEAVMLYAGRINNPRTILRHRPAVCYPSAGWSIVESSERFKQLGTAAIPTRVHRFLKPTIPEERHVVVESYNVNGVWTLDDPGFLEPRWRGTALKKAPAQQVTQLQIVVPVRWDFERAEQTAEMFLQQVWPQLSVVLQS